MVTGKVVGWDAEFGGQRATFSIFRNYFSVKKGKVTPLEGHNTYPLQGLHFEGEDSQFVEFENYKLAIYCKYTLD